MLGSRREQTSPMSQLLFPLISSRLQFPRRDLKFNRLVRILPDSSARNALRLISRRMTREFAREGETGFLLGGRTNEQRPASRAAIIVVVVGGCAAQR